MSRAIPSLVTKEFISGLRNQPGIPPGSWYFIAGSTLSTLNRPDEAANVLKFALECALTESKLKSNAEPALLVARKMRESMVKLTAIAGLPKTINSLLALKGVTPSEMYDEPLRQSPTLRSVEIHDVPLSRILQKGQGFFDSIYGKISKRVMGQMDRSGTEDLGITARLMYGYIISNTAILTPVETSYVIIAGLVPQDVNPQLKGHLKGALNNGATLDEVRAVRAMAVHICRMYGMRNMHQSDAGFSGWRSDIANV